MEEAGVEAAKLEAANPGPGRQRRRLGRELKVLREAAKKTTKDVAENDLVSETTLWRLETGRSPIKKTIVTSLCQFYLVDAETTARLELAATGTSQQGWWESYKSVTPAWFALYLDMETSANRMAIFDDGIVPGALQTPEYARGIFQAARPDASDSDLAPLVKLRLQRQRALFDRPQPPALTVVLGESALRRAIGGVDVLAKQVGHLQALSQRAHVDIAVVPFDDGAHAGHAGSFRILEFDENEEDDIVYLEHQVGATYQDQDDYLGEYRRIFGLLREQAVPIGEFFP